MQEEYKPYIEACDKRVEATKKLREEKAKNNYFKKVFYGIKKNDFSYKDSPYDKIRYKKLKKYIKKLLKNGVSLYGETFKIPSFKEGTIMWDYYDIEAYLIVSLTIKGIFNGLFGNSVTSKKVMSDCNTARRKLAKAFSDAELIISDPDKTNEELKEAFVFLGEHLLYFWD